ncbi:unnamed protein product [Orchesella dallaii]|uniref:Uncharacterized protein n=1 Tax=Orchesella dallaii TaxID=48710 RepID=A0ABP1RM25_9HEXA
MIKTHEQSKKAAKIIQKMIQRYKGPYKLGEQVNDVTFEILTVPKDESIGHRHVEELTMFRKRKGCEIVSPECMIDGKVVRKKPRIASAVVLLDPQVLPKPDVNPVVVVNLVSPCVRSGEVVYAPPTPYIYNIHCVTVARESVPNLCRICAESAQNVCRIGAESVRNLCRICAESLQNLCRIWAESVQNMCRICAE